MTTIRTKMISIYNTLTRKKEEFKPITEGKINMYVCGPTVYDVPHIGHARSSFIFDVIRRYLEYAGYEVLFVRNVTDVDDKIINKAKEELTEIEETVTFNSLKDRVKDVAERYLKIYHQQMDVFGIRTPSIEPKATESIRDMIKFIEILIDKGYAYDSGGSVYFSVDKFEPYGKLSNRDVDEMLHGVRIDVDSNKKYPLDFALWKEVKEGEPYWESPWGKGRPGWHIECSVMSTKLLGGRFDIHGGGLDLIFPHHENEIAQSEAATGEPFANYWIHNGLLTVNGEKMSKSLGNYITITDFLEKYKDPDLLKIAFLTSHYRSPMDCSDDRLKEAARTKERIMIFLDKVERATNMPGTQKEFSGEEEAECIEEMKKVQWEINALQERFEDAMNDDFNTSQALSVIFEAVKKGNDILSGDAGYSRKKGQSAQVIKNFIVRFADVLGLSLQTVELDTDLSARVESLIEKRQQARKDKDYAEADRIRDELTGLGVVVEDTPDGPVWRKK